MSLLSVEGLGIQFGGLHAVRDVSFSLKAGEIVSVIGPNGAGKTTLFNMISGFITPTEGRVYFAGEEITAHAPEEIAARGLVMAVMGFHFVFFAIDNTVWSVELVMEQISRTVTFGMTQFLYGGNPEDTSILQEGVRIIIPFVTWSLAHYAIAMIFFGEGSFKDICVSAAFSFGPYIVIAPIATFALTNSMTLNERSLFMTISWGTRLWVAYLFYTHIRVIHDFGTGRTLATYAIGAVTVIIIWALAALIFALSSNTYEFFYQVFYELTTR